MNIVAFLCVGLIAGFLSGKIVEGHGFGALGDIGLGIVGAFVGGFLFSQGGDDVQGFWGAVLMSTIGAVVVLLAANAIRSLLGRHAGQH